MPELPDIEVLKRYLESTAFGYHLAYVMTRKLGEVRMIRDVRKFVEARGLGIAMAKWSGLRYPGALHITAQAAKGDKPIMSNGDSLKEYQDARRNPTSTEPKSVLSNRTLDEIKQQEGDQQV